MKTIFLLITFCSFHAYGQQNDTTKKEVQELPEWVQAMDSIIDDSSKKHYDFTHISRLISEGSLIMIDTINGKRVDIGSGGFTRDTYTDRNKNQVIKTVYAHSISYNELRDDDLAGKFVRNEIDVYYKNEEPIFAIYLREVKDEKKIVEREYYHVQLTSNDDSAPKDIRVHILSEAKYAISRKR